MLLLLFACAADKDPTPGALAVGAAAPDFLLLDHTSAELRLADFAGQVLLLESAAEW